jgi:ABC-type cobalamin/Fe3+-siderophores transport system ATPase subunit
VSGAALEVRELALDYGPRLVLDDVSLELQPGELAALIGPNGAGKSSLLRCITGLVRPAAGSVSIDRRPVADIERASLARTLAVVPGQTVVAFPMRVEELVALGRVPHEHPLLGPRPVDRERIELAIDRVGIGHLRGRDVRELSLGERQLAVLAMAVAQDARLLLLDEPTVHLDLRHQVAIMELLRDLARRDGVTVLAVLHDIGLAAHFFERLLMLDAGRLLADGSPVEVLTASRVRAVYGVDPGLVLGQPLEAQPAGT